ncbi:PREDICTED: uncharacterized protein LOC109347962 [Lupinus angustifolius]|uniref:uncharacterized protein LOC109347962 n=1 Tax=Lupinus angustifolius TaxID=3871 RepID=UPI00092E7C3E|nr:PREDICTED: uncharacterized protein LOC109347962 [Lupinus angustifolius]
MASLIPGVLSKLLENAGNKDARVTGEHRHALLQVIEIVPCFSHNNQDPWQSIGYFLKLSDSLHSAYVSVPQNDADLICADKVQLGQFVYVTRLDSVSKTESSVPVVQGLNPVPKRRVCIGNTNDLLHIGVKNPTLEFRKSVNNNRNKNENRTIGLKKRDESVSVSKVKKKENVKVGVEMRRLSLDSSRRVWDHSPVSTKNAASSGSYGSRFKFKSASNSPNVIDKKVSHKIDSPVKYPTSSISPLKSKNENLYPKPTSTPPRKSTIKSPPDAGTLPSQLVKVPLNIKTCCDTSTTLWGDLPPSMCDLRKQVVTRRNVAFLAAVRSLEEAFASDTVIQCMCVFAELCQSCGTLSAGLLVKQFLELNHNLQRARAAFDSLFSPPLEAKPSSHSNIQYLVEDACKVPSKKNAISWVQAATGTNLSKFNLFRTKEKSEVLNGEKCYYAVIDNSDEEMNSENSSAENKQNRAAQPNPMSNATAKRLPSSKRNLVVAKNKHTTDKRDQSKESGLKEAASLAEKLLVASRAWFLKYLEESLCNGFGLRSEDGSSEITCLLGQLKKVNHWLDNLEGEDKVDHRVEKLRKSLYRFLLEHVNSAIASS